MSNLRLALIKLLILFLIIISIISSSCTTEITPNIQLLTPQNYARTGLHVEFSWAVYSTEGKSYQAEIFLDKGVGPFDGSYELKIDAGTNSTSFEADLNPTFFSGASVQWGVRIRIDGRNYDSPVRSFQVE